MGGRGTRSALSVSPGALRWAESRTREGSAEERKPEAGGAEGGAGGRGAPERIG